MTFIYVYLNFTADSTSLWVRSHKVDELLNRVVIRTRSNVKQQAVLRLQILADTLEEPLVGIDLTVVSMLDTEHKVDAAAAKKVLIKTEVPRSDLEAMKHIGWNLIRIDTIVHNVSHVSHLEILIAI